MTEQFTIVPQSDLRLYDLPALLDEIDATLTENGGEETAAITEMLDRIEGTLEVKGDRILFAALNSGMLGNIYQTISGDYNDLARSRKNKFFALTDDLARTLQALGRDTLETEHFSVHLESRIYDDPDEPSLELIFDFVPPSIAQRQAEIARPRDHGLASFTEMVGRWRVTSAEVKALEIEKRRISDLHAAREAMLTEIKECVLASLRALGKTRLETAHGTPRIQANPPSYRWVGDPWAMPESYRKPPAAPALDTRKIGEQFKTALPDELQSKLAAAKARGAEFTAEIPGTKVVAGEVSSVLEFHVGAHVRLG